MAVDLPELTLPSADADSPVTGAATGNAGLPPFLVEDHAIELLPLYGNTPMRTGHARRRRLYTAAPRVVTASLRLSQAQMTAFHDWFEGPLRAGAEWFSARVANQGPGLLWWKALYAAPPVEEVLPGSYWKVTQRLLLVGQGSATPPPSTSMRAAITCALGGSVVLNVPKALAAEVLVALEPALPFRAAIVVALVSGSNPGGGTGGGSGGGASSAFLLREDGGHLLREDGARILMES